MADAEILKDMSLAEVKSLIERKENVLVELWAPWCHPCELMKAVLEKIISSGKFQHFTFVRLDADEYPESYEEFRARALPALVGIRNGKAIGKLTGFHREDSTVTFLESI